jgi:threonine dehydrogenase-like Zn-dependent dehydrogenase
VPSLDELRLRGEIGGRTVVVTATGEVECAVLEPAPLAHGHVRVRTVRSALSPGTESTFVGRSATNVHLTRRWNDELRVFEDGPSVTSLPMPFGYRATGEIVESDHPAAPVGSRIWGNWRHTELVALPAELAARQVLPDVLSWDDGVDIGQMGPIAVNAAAFGAHEAAGRPAVVIGAGPIGLLTAQVVRGAGAGPVIVVDRLPGRLRIAEELGFATLDASTADVAVSLKSRWGADGIPVAWECSGAVPALAEAIRLVARKGLVVAVGFYQGGAEHLRLGDEFHHNGVRVVSAQIGNPFGSLTRRDLQERTLELALNGVLVLGGLPRVVMPVTEAAEAFAALRRPDEVLQVALDYADMADGATPASRSSSHRLAGSPPP